MKRFFDFILSFLGLFLLSPILLTFIFLVWKQDYKSPFYIANRVGRQGKNFKMVKLRTMIVDAAKTGVDSTSNNDPRITKIGNIIRKYKIDELTQLWNVLVGDMSLVGPRPNVPQEVCLYTNSEKKLISIRPGITDFSSIVFSDEGDILEGKDDPDIAYHQLIRPWKSRLGIFYVENHSLLIDFILIFLTIMSVISKKRTLKILTSVMTYLNADSRLVEIAGRTKELLPYPPPGAKLIISSRKKH